MMFKCEKCCRTSLKLENTSMSLKHTGGVLKYENHICIASKSFDINAVLLVELLSFYFYTWFLNYACLI